MAESYVLPQVLIQQEFNLNVAPPLRRLNAFIFGPHGKVFRYSEADEKALIYLGIYDNNGTNVDGEYKTCYDWPNLPLGNVDYGYTKLFIDNALLNIWTDTSHTMTKTASNKIRHPTIKFADSSTGDRSDALLRDIKAGDYVSVSSNGGDETLWTYVRRVEGDAVAASVAAVVDNENNAGSETVDTTVTRDSLNSTELDISASDATVYNGLADGDVTETYVITCTTASTGGDLTTAKLRVISASGNDDAFNVAPAAVDTPTDIGSRGLTVTFSADTGDDFVVGDTWTVEVIQQWEAPEATSGGTYTGTKDRTYVVEVTKGGLWSESPQITVYAADGSDYSGPTTISLTAGTTTTTTVPAGVAVTAAAPVGTYGVTIRFSDEGLNKGDRYLITATAATEGDAKTLVLAHALDSSLALDDDTIDLEVFLYIRKNIQVGERHILNDGDYNWGQSQTEFCAFADIYATDSSWADDDGPVPVPVISDPIATGCNKMYLEYRVWLSEFTTGINSIQFAGELDDIAGPITTDNPLKYALNKAVENNNGQPVRYMAVADPDDLESWQAVLEFIEERTDVYGLVPLTENADVLSSVEGHVNAQSTATAARWRKAWFGISNVTSEEMASATLSSDGEVILATTEEDAGTSGTQYTILRVTSANADLLELGVAPGDIVRFKYITDAWGDVTYSTYTVDEVLTEETLRLVSGTAVEENTPIKVEIHRTLSKTAQAEATGRAARAWDNRRIVCMFLNKLVGGQPVVPSYYVAAAEAALISGVAPQQGVTNYSINGFDALAGVTNYFSRTQLDVMAGSGVSIVAEDAAGIMYNRHMVTTSDYTVIKYREEMYGRNVDSISYYLFDLLGPYIGKTNATDDILPLLRAEINAGITFLKSSGATPKLGGQVREATIEDLRVSTTYPDRIAIAIACSLPFPFNNADVSLLV